MNVNRIIAEISKRDGLAKNNRFRVIVQGDSSETLDTLCETAILPGRAISTNEYTNGKQLYKVPYTFINSEVTLTFLLTNDYFVRTFFDTWMNSVVDFEGFRANYKSDYVRDVTIEQLDGVNNRVYGVKLINAFPLNINEVNLSNTEENSVARIEVGIAYDNFVTL